MLICSFGFLLLLLYFRPSAEGSHSGRVHHLGKVAYWKQYREFESPPLRNVADFIFFKCVIIDIEFK